MVLALGAIGLRRMEVAAQQAVHFPVRHTAGSPGDADSEPTVRIRREGTNVELTGVFRTAGDRVVFNTQDESESLRVLENLALERIVGVLDESSSERTWKVSGAVTEFRGANYLIVKRAMVDTGRRSSSAAGHR